MLALHGVAVLVTRPVMQANSLCHLLEAHGAHALRLPVVEIRPTGDERHLVPLLNPPEPYDLIIFTSANAVRFGAHLLPSRPGPTLAAIGPATARALTQAGFRVAIAPRAGFDSENLLLGPELQCVTGQRILLVKGVGGRELLQQELIRRGAQVVTADVYRRQRAAHTDQDLAAVHADLASAALVVITATSAEIAAGLIALATPALRRDLDHAHWLVPSARIAAAVREHGVAAPILQADSAGDQDLVSAIERWRSSVSGA